MGPSGPHSSSRRKPSRAVQQGLDVAHRSNAIENKDDGIVCKCNLQSGPVPVWGQGLHKPRPIWDGAI
jgi:hypothetical protein